MSEIDTHARGLKQGQLIQIEANIMKLTSELKFATQEQDKLIEELKFVQTPTEELVGKLNDMLKCYPEYSSEHIQCIKFGDYTTLTFDVMGDEGGQAIYSLNGSDLIHAWNEHKEKLIANFGDDPEEWDAEGVDCFMQYHFYGEIVYG